MAASNRFVGIFWAIQEPGSGHPMLLEHRCSLEEAEPYGTMLTCPDGHYEFWEQLRKGGGTYPATVESAIAISEYEEWPRGRIVYDRENDRFIVYADAQILRDAALMATVHERFGLPIERTYAKPDDHYISTRRLKS